MYSVPGPDGIDMTKSVNWFSEQHNGSSSAEIVQPAEAAPATRVATIRSPWLRLSRGMAICAAIEARVLGRRLLTLNADVTVLPAETADRGSVAAARPPARNPSDPHLGLDDAARALDAVAADLRAARARMP